MNNLLIVIPSRLGSKRLKNKPLIKIGENTLIECVYQNIRSIKKYKIIVATDSKKISKICKNNNIPTYMTKKHKTGSDRVAEVAQKKNFKWILNLQGDEPLISIFDVKNLIKNTINFEKNNNNFVASTLFVKKKFKNNIKSEVKLIINKKNEVLKFTRKKLLSSLKKKEYYKHIGIYLYKSKFLKKFPKLKHKKLEKKENLEQLRILENGYKVLAFKAKKDSIGVDTYKDLRKVRNYMHNKI